MPNPPQTSTAALSVLIILQSVMLSALYADVPPHPPVATPLFGMARFSGHRYQQRLQPFCSALHQPSAAGPSVCWPLSWR